MKRAFDIAFAIAGLTATAPLLLLMAFSIWLQDRHNPFYIAPRVGRHGRRFRMIKLRTMIVGADKTGVCSTSADDRRVTAVGHFIRRYKLDELTQLVNVLLGDMSVVGPRPNVESDTSTYTPAERGLLAVRPGITDLSSIVFADEAEILRGSTDPDGDYVLLIRPWKSRLGLIYIRHSSLALDFAIIGLTLLAVKGRSRALEGVAAILRRLGADPVLVQVSRRTDPLTPARLPEHDLSVSGDPMPVDIAQPTLAIVPIKSSGARENVATFKHRSAARVASLPETRRL